MLQAEETLTKTPSEVVTYPFNFRPSTGKGLRTGETITTLTSVLATPTTAPTLDIDQTLLSGDIVQARFTGGLVGTTYHVTATVQTTLSGQGQTRQLCGDLVVAAC